MEFFQSQLNDVGADEASPDAKSPSTLTDLFSNVYKSLQELTGDSKKAEAGEKLKSNPQDRYDSEIATLIFGVIRLGDKDLSDIMKQSSSVMRLNRLANHSSLTTSGGVRRRSHGSGKRSRRYGTWT